MSKGFLSDLRDNFMKFSGPFGPDLVPGDTSIQSDVYFPKTADRQHTNSWPEESKEQVHALQGCHDIGSDNAAPTDKKMSEYPQGNRMNILETFAGRGCIAKHSNNPQRESHERNETQVLKDNKILIECARLEDLYEKEKQTSELLRKGKSEAENRLEESQRKLKNERKKVKQLKKQLEIEHQENSKVLQEKTSSFEAEISTLTQKQEGRLNAQQREYEKKLQEQASRYEEKLSRLRKCIVQLYYQGQGDSMLKVLGELKRALVSKLGKRRHELYFVTCVSKTDIDPGIPLLVICPNISRIGTNAASALQHIDVSPNTLLIVLHHKDKHVLPSQTSDRVLTGEGFKELGGICDIGFLSDKGIYQCEQNDNSITVIADFITSIHAD